MQTRIERVEDFLARLNHALAVGFTADCILVCPGMGYNFSRLTGTIEELDRSYGRAVNELRAAGIAIPRDYDTSVRPLIHRSAGAGYRGDNPHNPAGMGLVLSVGLWGTAVGMTLADAPAAVLIHTPTGVRAAVTGVWTQLPLGTVEQTIQLMKQTVEELDQVFDVADLWVILSPGARGETFFIDERGRQKLVEGGVPYGLRRRLVRLETPVIDERGRVKTYALDLSALFADLWEFAGIPKFQIHFDPRNNMTERDQEGNLILPSKRRADEAGEPGYSSGLLAVVVRKS